jgi:hypothetical protein
MSKISRPESFPRRSVFNQNFPMRAACPLRRTGTDIRRHQRSSIVKTRRRATICVDEILGGKICSRDFADPL